MDVLVKITLLLAVAVVFPVSVALGIEAFLPMPEVDRSECYPPSLAVTEKTQPIDEAQWKVEREKQRECEKKIDAIIQPHEAKVFAITAVVGLLAIGIGALIFVDFTGPGGPGLVLGGLITILYGAMRTFQTVDKRWLFFVAVTAKHVHMPSSTQAVMPSKVFWKAPFIPLKSSWVSGQTPSTLTST